MSKVEMNNEIISLRHMVRQARVCTINKLVKEAKLLRNKHGNTKQQEKYKRKADKLIAEVYTLKKIKDDDITKFGILNEKELKDILQDQSCSNRNYIIAKVAHYKPFYRKLIQFREKFPDYKKYLSKEEKQESKKSKNKNVKALSKKSPKKNSHSLQDTKLKEQEINSDKNIEHIHFNSEDDKTGKIKLCEEKGDSHNRKKLLNKNIVMDEEKFVKDSISETVAEQQSIPCGVTKEAVVKTFKELIEEQESVKDEQMSAECSVSVTTAAITQKEIDDDFFTIGNDEEDYRENSNDTSMSDERLDISIKGFRRSSNRIRIQNAKYKSDTGLNKIKKYNQPKCQVKSKISQCKKYSNKQSLAVEQGKETLKKINKDNSSINNKEKTAGLHPSWLAKKKQQEMLKQGFQGKKIVFAD